MVIEGAAQEHMKIVWLLLQAASAGVFLHAGIKFPWFVFFQKDSGLRPSEPPWNMRAAMILCSALCIGLGVMPQLLYAQLPFKVDYAPYTTSHIIGQLQLLLFSGLAFFLMLDLLKRTMTITLDVDWLWRRLGWNVLSWFDTMVGRWWAITTRKVSAASLTALARIQQYHGQGGMFGRTWPTGTMAFWMTVMLGAFLILAYI